MSHNKSNPESGFALLLVFAMAAIVAITLYMEVPRVAFEAQRDKEDLLMSRGHEYIRAITLYVHKFNKFPASMDELENTNRMRFLRRRYTDPMTGKADWRLLHAGPGGVITDSITGAKKETSAQQTFITEMQMFGVNAPGSDEGVNLAARKRVSDQGGAGSPGGGLDLNISGQQDLNSPPPAPPPPPVPVMVLADGSIVPATATGVPATSAQPAGAPQGVGGFPGAPGASGNGTPMQLQNPQNNPNLPGQQGPPTTAAGLINQILTSPRPGGLAGLPVQPGVATQQPNTGIPGSTPGPGNTITAAGTATPAGQQVVGGGLAGVASKREQEGIKSYNQKSKYNEWEFVYDISKDPTKARPGAVGASGAQGGTGGTNTLTPPLTLLPPGGLVPK